MSEQRTVRVRIAVGVLPSGEWSAGGASGAVQDAWNTQTPEGLVRDDLSHLEGHLGMQFVWVEADIPLPQPVTVEGTVSDE